MNSKTNRISECSISRRSWFGAIILGSRSLLELTTAGRRSQLDKLKGIAQTSDSEATQIRLELGHTAVSQAGQIGPNLKMHLTVRRISIFVIGPELAPGKKHLKTQKNSELQV